jgi:hypothetical protein
LQLDNRPDNSNGRALPKIAARTCDERLLAAYETVRVWHFFYCSGDESSGLGQRETQSTKSYEIARRTSSSHHVQHPTNATFTCSALKHCLGD